MTDTAKLVVCLLTSCSSLFLVHWRANRDIGAIAGAVPHAPKASPVVRWGVIVLAGLAITSFFLFLTARPGLSLVLCLALYFLLYVVNLAKIQILHEPLVLADIWLLRQVFLYPGMYFPFLPVKTLLAVCGIVVSGIVLLFLLEPPLSRTQQRLIHCGVVVFLIAPVALLFAMRHGWLSNLARLLLAHFPPSHCATAGAVHNGTLPSTFIHPIWAGVLETTGNTPFSVNEDSRPPLSRWPDRFEEMFVSVSRQKKEKQPHVIMVQAESFCDVREKFQGKQQQELASFLPHWDALCAKGQTLPTPEGAFGAYTMRTEFSVLTGLSQKALGPWAFNPFLAAQKKKMWSLARHFSQVGYETIFIHPYHKDFFRRDRVMANLGFQQFWDIEACKELERFGPHVSDIAVAEHLNCYLAHSSSPVFAFFVTIEAHSPWPNDRLTDKEITTCLHDIDVSLFNRQMQIYLCHLRNMDNTLGLLQNSISLPATESNVEQIQVWAYGDHEPSIDFSACSWK